MEEVQLQFGGKNEWYSWTQDTRELVVQIPVPEGTRGKELNITMTNKNLKVVLNKGGESKVIVEGEWYKDISSEDSFWTLSDNIVEMIIQKYHTRKWDSQLSQDKTWWKAAIKGHPENENENPPNDYYFSRNNKITG